MAPRFIYLGAAAATLSLLAAPPAALAYIQQEAGTGQQASSTYQEGQQNVQLSPIVIAGQHLPFPIVLQMIKTALGRPWSSARADQDKMVCRFDHALGSHLPTLRCETNAQYFREMGRTRTYFFLASAGAYGNSPTPEGMSDAIERGRIPILAEVADWANGTSINPSALKRLLAKLPPAGSSYTLEITDHGKPVVTYVIKNGELVKVYVVKKDAAKGGS